MNGVVLAIMAAACASGPPAADPQVRSAGWRFAEETISVNVLEDRFTVLGEYRFALAEDACPLVFRYPFPDDDSLGEPVLMEASIDDGSGWKALNVSPGDGCWRWLASPGTSGRCAIRVRYQQATTNGTAHYVLTSARDWDRPIDRVRIEVRVPPRQAYRIIPILTIAPDGDQCSIYSGEFRDFSPDTDLVIVPVEDE